MKLNSKIILINLGIFLLYILFALGLPQYMLTVLLSIIPLHLIALMIMAIISFVEKKTGNGQAYLLSLFLIVLIGLSVCS